MGITLLITSLLLNVYLFYKYIKERVDKINYKYNHTQRVIDNAKESLVKLSISNKELEKKVTEIIKRRNSIQHENI